MTFKAAFRWIWCRQPGIMFLLAFMWAIIVPYAWKSDLAFVGGLFVLGTWGVITASIDSVRLNRLKAAVRLDDFGETLAWVPVFLTPGTSMIECLEEKANVSSSDIDVMLIQTCKQGHPYLDGFKDMLSERNVQPKRLEFIGLGSNDDLQETKRMFPGASVWRSSKKLTAHFNILGCRGRYFIWYEPEHNVRTHEEFLPQDGAFLVEVDPDKVAAALARYSQEKAA